MPKVKDVAILNIDNVPTAVDTLSKEAQALVSTFNEWNQTIANKQQELQMHTIAIEALQQQIVAQLRKDKEAKDKEAKDTEAVAPVVEAPTAVADVAPAANDAAAVVTAKE